jgi:ParB-like chromosome segregation protein Spo0J
MTDEIFSTFDYSLFTISVGNGQLNENKVKQLIKSMKKEYRICPITVKFRSRVFHIIDGKHRFMAAKRLGLPIYYKWILIY